MEVYTITKAKRQKRHLGTYFRNCDPHQICDVVSGDGREWPYYSIGIIPKDNNAPIRRLDSLSEVEKLYTRIE